MDAYTSKLTLQRNSKRPLAALVTSLPGRGWGRMARKSALAAAAAATCLGSVSAYGQVAQRANNQTLNANGQYQASPAVVQYGSEVERQLQALYAQDGRNAPQLQVPQYSPEQLQQMQQIQQTAGPSRRRFSDLLNPRSWFRRDTRQTPPVEPAVPATRPAAPTVRATTAPVVRPAVVPPATLPAAPVEVSPAPVARPVVPRIPGMDAVWGPTTQTPAAQTPATQPTFEQPRPFPGLSSGTATSPGLNTVTQPAVPATSVPQMVIAPPPAAVETAPQATLPMITPLPLPLATSPRTVSPGVQPAPSTQAAIVPQPQPEVAVQQPTGPAPVAALPAEPAPVLATPVLATPAVETPVVQTPALPTIEWEPSTESMEAGLEFEAPLQVRTEPQPSAVAADGFVNPFPELSESAADEMLESVTPYSGMRLESDAYANLPAEPQRALGNPFADSAPRMTPFPQPIVSEQPLLLDLPLPEPPLPPNPAAEPATQPEVPQPEVPQPEVPQPEVPQLELTPSPADWMTPIRTGTTTQLEPQALPQADEPPALLVQETSSSVPAELNAASGAQRPSPAADSGVELPQVALASQAPVVVRPSSAADLKMAMIRSRAGMTGFKGFCPVMLRDRRELVDAQPNITAQYEGHTYSFSSETAKVAFLSNPGAYTAAAHGVDLVHYATTGERRDGMLDYAAWYQGRLYLFNTAEAKQTFTAAPRQFSGVNVE